MRQSIRKTRWRTVVTLSVWLVLAVVSAAWALAPAAAQPEVDVSSPRSIDYDLSGWTVDGAAQGADSVQQNGGGATSV